MSRIKDEVEAANAAYTADFGDKGSLALPPARGFLILTCMDARLVSTPASPRGTPMWCAMPAAEPPTTRSAAW